MESQRTRHGLPLGVRDEPPHRSPPVLIGLAVPQQMHQVSIVLPAVRTSSISTEACLPGLVWRPNAPSNDSAQQRPGPVLEARLPPHRLTHVDRSTLAQRGTISANLLNDRPL
eukprot:15438081-Alexandrium_andersonii.AAC.2